MRLERNAQKPQGSVCVYVCVCVCMRVYRSVLRRVWMAFSGVVFIDLATSFALCSIGMVGMLAEKGGTEKRRGVFAESRFLSHNACRRVAQHLLARQLVNFLHSNMLGGENGKLGGGPGA